MCPCRPLLLGMRQQPTAVVEDRLGRWWVRVRIRGPKQPNNISILIYDVLILHLCKARPLPIITDVERPRSRLPIPRV